MVRVLGMLDVCSLPLTWCVLYRFLGDVGTLGGGDFGRLAGATRVIPGWFDAIRNHPTEAVLRRFFQLVAAPFEAGDRSD